MTGGDLGTLLFGTSGSELKSSDCEKFRSSKIFGVEGSSGMPRSGGASRMDSGRCVSLGGRYFGSLDTFLHPDAGQILITTDASHFPTCRSCGREVGETKHSNGLSMP